MINPYQNLWADNKIGKGTKLGAFVDIGGAIIGKNCKIQCFVSIPPGVKIEDEVFIGPHVSFANDKYPKAKGIWNPRNTIVGKGASIGMAAVIGTGIKIGKGAVIGMGAVVTKNVPAGETWVGNPARKLK